MATGLDISPPVELKNPLIIPHKLLMGPGPSNAAPRILQALSQPVLGHMFPELFKIMDDIKKGIQYVFQTKNDLTLAISGAGHAGMEAIMCNLIEPGDKVLILAGAFWGERVADVAKRTGAVIKILQKTPGNQNFSFIEIENAVKNFLPQLLFIVQGESATGIYQPLEGIGEITRRYNTLLAVDTVASLGAVPVFMDKWKIDALYTGSQKIIGVVPGITPISFSAKAKEVILKRKSPIGSYYVDMRLLGQQWNCFEKDLPRIYHHTTSANLLYALREGLAIISEEGLENVIKRHQDCASLLYKGIERLGLEFFVEEEHKRLPSVTTVKVPENVDYKDIVGYLMKQYQLEIGGGLGPMAGKIFRIGLMGYNATPDNVNLTLKALKEAIDFTHNKKLMSKM